jgi:hypothetical protein
MTRPEGVTNWREMGLFRKSSRDVRIIQLRCASGFFPAPASLLTALTRYGKACGATLRLAHATGSRGELLLGLIENSLQHRNRRRQIFVNRFPNPHGLNTPVLLNDIVPHFAYVSPVAQKVLLSVPVRAQERRNNADAYEILRGHSST